MKTELQEGQVVQVTNEYGETFTGTLVAIWKTSDPEILRIRFETENGNAWNVHTDTHQISVLREPESEIPKPIQEEPRKPMMRPLRNDCLGLSWDQIEAMQGGVLAR